tara:strand:- start:2856 stop:3716 length:861 start_codon:yes stop_codon:yes gene_type:complete
MRVLIFGVTGMLGNTLFKYLNKKNDYDVIGTSRSSSKKGYFSQQLVKKIIHFDDITSQNSLQNFINQANPDIVINCIGVIKQLKSALDPLYTIPINSLLPHYLNKICTHMNIRLVHFSTDCVFNGKQGFYDETDKMTANDLYGMSKYLGEVKSKNSLTIRTSIIGHELSTKNGLVEWFLSQKSKVFGYKNAFFNGLPTIEIAEILDNYLLKDKSINGLFHVSGQKISKFDLLNIINKVYNKNIEIIPTCDFKIDRTLNSEKFYIKTNYTSPNWDKLIKKMHDFETL